MTTNLFARDQYGYNFLALLDTTIKEVKTTHHRILEQHHTEMKLTLHVNSFNTHIPRCTEFAVTQFEGFFVRWQRKGRNNLFPSL